MSVRTLVCSLVLGLLVLAAPTARAEGLLDTRLAERAEMKRRSGRTLTIMGIVHLAIGGALLIEMGVQTRSCAQQPGCMNEMGGLPELVAGSLLASSGAVFLTAGAPMWAIGRRDGQRLGISASAGGLRITF